MVFHEVEQIDIAPSIASILNIPFACDGKPISKIVRYAHNCKRVLLVIVDSLGFEEYVENRRYFPFLASMEKHGYLFKCLCYSHSTTPSIATILCGLRPEKHNVMKAEDAYLKKVKCLPEVAHEVGFKVAVVMEEYGAFSFQCLVDLIKPVADVPDVLEFDERSCLNAIEVLRELDPNLLIVHLRSLDSLGIIPKTMLHVDESLREVAEQLIGETIFFVVGDHPPHNKNNEMYVALIVFKISTKTCFVEQSK